MASSVARVNQIETKLQTANQHLDTLLALRKQGYPVVPLRQDPLFADVELSKREQDIYVVNVEYRPKAPPALIKKVLICNSQLHFNPKVQAVISDIEAGTKQLHFRYRVGSCEGVVSFACPKPGIEG